MSGTRPPTPGRLRLTFDRPAGMVLEIEPPAAEPSTSGDPDPADAGRGLDPLPRPLADRGGPARYEVVLDGWRFEVEVESAARAALRERASRAGGRGLGGGPQIVRAQIPGRVVAVGVSAGDAVEAGQRLLSVEAMKMENAVVAPWAGTIARVAAVAGQTVELGDELVVIE
jgi:biotin carboxyl carrier protein